MKKPTFYSEWAYLLAVLMLAVGNSLVAYGDWGMSMVIAPAYVLHLALVEVLPFFSFGVAEYTVQALIIVVLVIMNRRIKLRYFLSFCTTLLYGLLLDGMIWVMSALPQVLWLRILAGVVGTVTGSAGVGIMFCAYFPPGLYEVLVKEITDRRQGRLGVVKTVYDVCSLLVATSMSLLLFGTLRGIGIGTVVGAFLNGTLIHYFGKWFNQWFEVKDALPWRRFFEEI